MADRNAGDLSGLLSLIERDPATELHIADWRKLLGTRTVELLSEVRILTESRHVRWYPCELSRDHTCALKVECDPDGSPSQPFVASCPGLTSGPLRLAARDLTIHTFHRDAFMKELRRAFRVDGPMDFTPVGCREVFRIGDLRGRPAYLGLMPGFEGFEFWLAHCGEAYVMVPIGRWLSTLSLGRCLPGSATEVIVLADVLEMREGGLVAHWPKAPREITCVAYGHEGRFELTDREYRRLVARAAQYDLFLDTTYVARDNGYLGHKRHLDGTREETVLSRSEAAAIVELASRRVPMRLGQFRSIDVGHLVRIVEHARKKLDVTLEQRSDWRSIQTHKGITSEANEFHFHPPADLKWLVVASLSMAGYAEPQVTKPHHRPNSPAVPQV